MQSNTSKGETRSPAIPRGPPRRSHTAVGEDRWPTRSSLTLPKLYLATYKYIFDHSIKSPTLILTADHLTLLFLPGFFYQRKNFLFLLWVNLYMFMGLYLHDPPPFNGPFFMSPPFSESQKGRGHEKWAVKRGRVMQICVRDYVEVHPRKKKVVLYFVKKPGENRRVE